AERRSQLAAPSDPGQFKRPTRSVFALPFLWVEQVESDDLGPVVAAGMSGDQFALAHEGSSKGILKEASTI
ncbi:MAG TPA: hypothetical protein VHH13_13385, partial [Arthrobacter sp.]|nr:hypothetical protein [Arthrobacter sp.]